MHIYYVSWMPLFQYYHMKGRSDEIPNFKYEAHQYCLNCSFPIESKIEDESSDMLRELKPLKEAGKYFHLYNSLTVTCPLTNCGMDF